MAQARCHAFLNHAEYFPSLVQPTKLRIEQQYRFPRYSVTVASTLEGAAGPRSSPNFSSMLPKTTERDTILNNLQSRPWSGEIKSNNVNWWILKRGTLHSAGIFWCLGVLCAFMRSLPPITDRTQMTLKRSRYEIAHADIAMSQLTLQFGKDSALATVLVSCPWARTSPATAFLLPGQRLVAAFLTIWIRY